MPMPRQKARVCVVGAGSSGITVCRSLKARGIDFDCFEEGSFVGGLWRDGNDNRMPGIYRSLFPNTSTRIMQFGAFPMPDSYPHFPHNRLVADYFDAFVDHFDLRRHIEFRSPVEGVSMGDRTWHVRLASGDVRQYTDVVVASGGHHRLPYVPTIPGSFAGEQLHSSDYRSPEPYADRRVVVVGSGASAADIAVEVSRRAAEVSLSVRTGAYFVPKFFKGQPADRLSSPIISRIPVWVRRPIYTRMLRTMMGDLEDHGMPRPPYKLLEGPLTPNSELFNVIGHGLVTPRAGIERLDGQRVHFADGTATASDAVIFATGYRISFPFLPQELLAGETEAPPLYLRMAHPDAAGLYFAGLLQPVGATMPLAEAQGDWIAELVDGEARLPSQADMRRSIEAMQQASRKRYVDDAKGLFLEPYDYSRELRRARRQALKRARRR